jgi:4-azaleucine resistance transporter AzlC
VTRHPWQGAPPTSEAELAPARRTLILSGLAFSASGIGFGLVYGLAAREAGFSVVEATAMSVFVNAGAAQFAAVGLISQGAAWPTIVAMTALLNARHLLYAAALGPWVMTRSRLERAAMAHVLTDETFALSLAHFRRLGRSDPLGYWLAAAFDCIPWPLATAVGALGGQLIPDPTRFGLDVIFPAAMAGLAVGLVRGRAEVSAAVVGAILAIGAGLAMGPAAGIVAGGLLGPVAGLLMRDADAERPEI